MLRDFDCRYVIVGHSERRQLFDESDEVVADKLIAAQNVGLTPILCVGETLDERESGATQAVVGRQLEVAVERAGIRSFLDVVIAYEPVWAIGTGRTATPEQAQLVHHYIRQRLAERDPAVAEGVRILYGGSVKAANAAELCAMSDVDGGLVGGASLDTDEFLAICRVASDQWVSADSSPRG